MTTETNVSPLARAASLFQKTYLGCAGIVLFGGVPIMLLGMAYFGGGFGSALSSFRMGLREGFINWLFFLPLALLPAYLLASKFSRRKASLLALLLAGTSCVFGLFLAFAHFEDAPVSERPSACHRGVYRLADGRLMTVSMSPVAALSVDLSDGTRIMTWGSDNQYSGTACIGPDSEIGGGFEMTSRSCPANEMNVHTHDAAPQRATRIPLQEHVADFEVNEVKFRARLFRPSGANKHAPVVIIPAWRDGGSRLDWGRTHYMLAGLGAAVFVYDKAQSWPYGSSETKSDTVALGFAVAAMNKVRSLLPEDPPPVGFYGDRDALAAAIRTKANFTILDSPDAPSVLLGKVQHPVLWFYPVRTTGSPTRLVRQLNASGKKISLVTLPAVDEHGAWYERRDTARCHINEPPHYWQTVDEWLRRTVGAK